MTAVNYDYFYQQQSNNQLDPLYVYVDFFCIYCTCICVQAVVKDTLIVMHVHLLLSIIETTDGLKHHHYFAIGVSMSLRLS
jgi:hypothetical protein